MIDDTGAGGATRRDSRREHAETLDHASGDTNAASGRLAVRCPSCNVPMDVAVDASLTELTCGSCGEHFSLVDEDVATREAPSITQLGRFELIDRLGVGSFGAVWKARDRELDRTVAIKIPRRGDIDAAHREKFFKEARAAAQLRHPNIVSVHEVGRDGEQVYIVSDFVRGVTLGDWLTGQRLTGREAAELCAKLANALDHAHAQGVIHRDIKPANILIDADGEPHLMDFGLARREVGEVTMTVEGQIMGTPAYMAPEQAAGDAHLADRRSDIYSLGVILYQLLCGELPFRGNARMLLHQVINDPPPSPRKFNAAVAKDLETIALKCLEKDPTRRYQSAQELDDELQRYLHGEPINARPVGLPERAWRWCRRRPQLAALSAALLATLLTISVVAPGIAIRQTTLRRLADASAHRAQEALKAAEEAKANAVKAREVAAMREEDARKSEVRAQTSADHAAREAESATRMANFVGAQYALTQGKFRDAFQQVTAAIASQPSWEYGRLLGDVVDKSRSDWQLLAKIPVDKRPDWGCFVGSAPDWLVVSQGGELVAHALMQASKPTRAQIAGSVPCALGDDLLALATPHDSIVLLALPDLKQAASCPTEGRIIDIRADDAGDKFVAVNDQGLVRVFDRDGRQVAERKFPPAKAFNADPPSVDISPSGRKVLFNNGEANSDVFLWDWQSGSVEQFTFGGSSQRLASDDLAYSYSPSSFDSSEVYILSLRFSSDSQRTLIDKPGFIYNRRGRLECLETGEAPTDIALVLDNAITVCDPVEVKPRPGLDPQPSAVGGDVSVRAARFDSFWPSGETPPKFLAYSPPAPMLALATEGQILLYTRWLPNERRASVELRCSAWSLAAAGDKAFAPVNDDVQILDLNSLDTTNLSLDEPTPEKDAIVFPCGASATPEGNRLAVLWQEQRSDDAAHNENLRKFLSIYDLSLGVLGRGAKRVGNFDLAEFQNSADSSDRGMAFSAKGDVVVVCGMQSAAIGYKTANGEKVYQLPAPKNCSYAFCTPASLVGAGSYAEAGDYLVYDIATGAKVQAIPLKAPVVHAAFSPTGDVLYVGLYSELMQAYRLSDGRLLFERKTRTAPITIAPTGDRYLGFEYSGSTTGPVVLADLSNGRTLETLNPSGHVLNSAFFNPSGRTCVFVKAYSRCEARSSIEVPDALRRLESPAIASPSAAVTANLRTYRLRQITMLLGVSNRLARFFDSGISANSAQFADQAREPLSQAHIVALRLKAQFPDDAAILKRLADVEKALEKSAARQDDE